MLPQGLPPETAQQIDAMVQMYAAHPAATWQPARRRPKRRQILSSLYRLPPQQDLAMVFGGQQLISLLPPEAHFPVPWDLVSPYPDAYHAIFVVLSSVSCSRNSAAELLVCLCRRSNLHGRMPCLLARLQIKSGKFWHTERCKHAYGRQCASKDGAPIAVVGPLLATHAEILGDRPGRFVPGLNRLEMYQFISVFYAHPVIFFDFPSPLTHAEKGSNSPVAR